MKWIVWANINLAVLGSRLAASLPAGTPGGAEQGSQDFVTQSEKSKAEGEEAGLDGRVCLIGGAYYGIRHKFSWLGASIIVRKR